MRPNPSDDPVIKTRAIIVSLSENHINETFANCETLFRALLEGTQPEVMSVVHGSRLLLAEVNCAWPLHNFLGHDAATNAWLQYARWQRSSARAAQSICLGVRSSGTSRSRNQRTGQSGIWKRMRSKRCLLPQTVAVDSDRGTTLFCCSYTTQEREPTKRPNSLSATCDCTDHKKNPSRSCNCTERGTRFACVRCGRQLPPP